MPSSKKKRGRKRKLFPNRKNSAQHFKDWATVGREVKVNGKDLTVYSRGKLLQAFANCGIPRTYTTIVHWERDGILPKSPIIINGKSFYTEGMIEAIVLTAVECGVGGVLSSTEYFKERVWKSFNNIVEKELM